MMMMTMMMMKKSWDRETETRETLTKQKNDDEDQKERRNGASVFSKVYFLPLLFLSFFHELFVWERRRIETLESHRRRPLHFFPFLFLNGKEKFFWQLWCLYADQPREIWTQTAMGRPPPSLCVHPTSFFMHLPPLKGAIGALLLLCVQLLKLDGCFFYSILFSIPANAQPMEYYTLLLSLWFTLLRKCGKNNLIHILQEKETIEMEANRNYKIARANR